MSNLPLARNGSSAIETATQAAKEAGNILLSNFYTEIEVKRKGKGNLVTEVDTLSEKLILELLEKQYPGCNILSEESKSSSPISGYTWVVDPLDGTNNYFFGIPFFCINIALVNDGDVLLGITYDPVRKELFYTEKGQGAYLGGSSIHVSKINLLEKSLVGLDLGYSQKQGKELLKITNNLWGKVHCLRIMGSSALGLAYVACGRITTYIHRFVYPWDIASGLLLINESGGKVTDWQGKPATIQTQGIISSNKRLHKKLIECLIQNQV